MANVKPIDRSELGALEKVLGNTEAMMGFVPNSMTTMAHMPQLTMAFSILGATVFGADLKAVMAGYADNVPEDPHAGEALPPDLIQLVAFSVSVAAGCRYCQAHTSHNAHKFGIAEEKLAAVLSAAESDAFTPAEVAAVELALAAGRVPNEAEPHHFEALAPHFTQRQIVQLVAVISMFGFLNRWNDTMATQLEGMPAAFAESTLGSAGWQVGKHASRGG